LENSATNKPVIMGSTPYAKPTIYVAVTRLYIHGKLIDEYETRFGIRSVVFDPAKGILVNGKSVRVQV
jgi:beta-galactosidase